MWSESLDRDFDKNKVIFEDTSQLFFSLTEKANSIFFFLRLV